MTEDLPAKTYTEQVISIIEGFVQMWIKFESMLHTELARTHKLNSKASTEINNEETNYTLFYRASSIIYPRGQITMGELSAALSVTFSKATRIINWLVDSGYVKRLPDAHDRRIVRVALTDDGLNLHQRINTYITERVQELLTSSLNEDERRILFTLIHKVASALQEVAG